MSKRFKLFDTTERAIELEGMEFHAFHGCLEQERREGNTFIVDFYAETDLSEAAESDDLKDTVDYGKVYDIVAREMAIPSNLLEHVASRILKAVEKEFEGFTYTRVRVSKKNPPVSGTCAWSRVTVASGQRFLDRI
ncbi:MAG: dihydroneopterin aldolase [Bacteroidales bacterium]|nr:dihydroneopterin aldolase [Bacteroidales bacterium]